jgi:DNA-directed RNA polymerase subunit E'/Rpb7
MNRTVQFSKKVYQDPAATATNQPNTPKLYGVYIPSILTTKLVLHITKIGKNIKQTLEKKLVQKISNKCISEGFIKPQSVKIQTYSAGIVPMSSNITYMVVYECMVCFPVEGMVIEAKVKNITKAGFRCEVTDESGNMPVIVFIIREHSVINEVFNSVKEEDTINVKVIGVTFELNDPYISVIGELAGKAGNA